MASRKRKAEAGGEGVAAKRLETTSVRITRSATRLANSNLAESDAELAKAEVTKNSKKGKITGNKKEKEEVKSEENESDKVKVEEDMQTEKQKSEEDADGNEWKEKTVVIEHCKQCNSFKTRANQVRDGLEKGVPGIEVVLNPEKPRRGCFEIREEGGKKFISLLDMKRPFKPMKDLEMNKVISDIIVKLK